MADCRLPIADCQCFVALSKTARCDRHGCVLRICDFNTFYAPTGGGVRQYLDHKIEFMSGRKDICYSMIVPGDSNRIDTVGSARRYWVAGPKMPMAANYRWIASAKEVRRILKAEQPHVIEVGAPYLSPWLARIAARGIDTRLIGFWHSSFPSSYVYEGLKPYSEVIGRMAESYAWRYARMAYRHYDAVFAASRFVVDDLRRHGIGPVVRTPLGVDTELYTPERRNKNTPSGLLYVGRLAGEKGVRTLFKAFPAIHEQNPGARLTIVGDGPLADDAKELADHYENVHYLGFVADRERVADLMASASAVVTPGGHETFSLTTAEALSSGVPVVCADQGAAAELVKLSTAGLLYREGSEANLAKALLLVLGWPEEQRAGMVERGRRYVVENHDWKSVFEHQLHCYRRIVGRIPTWE